MTPGLFAEPAATEKPPGKVPLPLLLADVAGWEAFLADPTLTPGRLAWAVSVGVMDWPAERLQELALECRDRLRDRIEEAE